MHLSPLPALQSVSNQLTISFSPCFMQSKIIIIYKMIKHVNYKQTTVLVIINSNGSLDQQTAIGIRQ